MTISDKIRIYELSRDLNLDNKDILDAAQKLSISVKSHSSSITTEDAKKIKNLLNKKTKLKSDTDFVQRLLEQANVAVVQGSAFGLPGYFRISYATSMENLKKAMDRIKEFCESLY